jgi:hypothetical protein
LEIILLLRPNSYADAEGWDDLVHAFIESLNRSFLDEMILLVCTGIPERWPKYVRLVSYNIPDEVPELLRSVAPSILRSGTTSARQQQPHVEVVARVQSDNDHDRRGQKRRVEMPQESVADGKEAEADMSGRDHGQEINEIREPLACVLECLDAIKVFAESEKKEVKRLIMAGDNKNLEVLMETLCQYRCDGIYHTLH